MQIYSINPFKLEISKQNTSFQGRGKPIDLKYILENRKNHLPKRVLSAAENALTTQKEQLPSLKELHQAIYQPLLQCTTLDEAKGLFPEFSNIAEQVVFARDSIYKREFENKTKDINFPLKMIQDLWARLKTKEEIAQELGIANRTSLAWALKQINFISYSSGYKALLKASDPIENSIIAQKTTAFNKRNPELMYARNKHAAQFCKTPEYRAAQRERMLEYDKTNPQRREKISEFDKRTWELCPEIKEALSMFAAEESAYTRGVVMKKIKGFDLSERERRVEKGFYKRFWKTFPHFKAVLAAAKEQVRKEMKK